MSVYFQSPLTLSKKDFSIFHYLFVAEIERLLPVKGTVYFWENEGTWLAKDQAKKLLGKESTRLPKLCGTDEPTILNIVIVLPLAMTESESIAILISDIDPSILKKMAPEWLGELRDDIHQALLQIKDLYVYPETGLYSSRVLDLIWNDTFQRDGAFFLLGCPERNKHATGNLVKLIRKAHLVETVLSGPVCYLGGNVFGIYQEGITIETSLQLARRLLGRLKREGAPYIQIGITQVSYGQRRSKECTLDECWRALEIAEKRGPFSLCEASFVHNTKQHPFALPDAKTVRKLQNYWGGLQQFSLLLVRPEKGGFSSDELETLVQETRKILPGANLVEPQGWQEKYILLPDLSAKKAKEIASRVKKILEKKHAPLQIAVGVSFWPHLDFFKTAVLVNCRKALMHGDFFGSGSLTVFDHITLNVSGDHYFDEGDYRKAVKEYAAGLKIKPGEVNLLNSLGVALIELNRLTEAIRCFDSVLQRKPKNFMALVNKGFAMHSLKKSDEALVCLQGAQKCREFSSSPVFTDVSILLGKLLSEKKQYKEAIQVLEKLVKGNTEKTGYLIYSLLGEAYAATGKRKKAIKNLQKTVQLNPHDANSLSLLGELYGIEGEGGDIALSLCTQAVNLNDQSWENWYRLAKIRSMAGDYHEADEAIKESLRRNRKAVDALFLSGTIQEKKGNYKLARKRFEKVIQIAHQYPGANKALQRVSKI